MLHKIGCYKRTFLNGSLLVLIMIISGCASSPIHEYELSVSDDIIKASKNTPLKMSKIVAVSQIVTDSIFDNKFIYYQREKGKIESFVSNKWVANPSQMLQPIFVATLEKTNQFSAVISLPSDILAQFRLEVSLIKLKLNYLETNHTAELMFRVRLVNVNSGALYYSKVYERSEKIIKNNAKSGVDAVNEALSVLIVQIMDDITKKMNAIKLP